MAVDTYIYEKEDNGNPIRLLSCANEPLTKFQINGHTKIVEVAGGSQLVNFTQMANDEHYNSTNQPTDFTFDNTLKKISYRQHENQTVPKFPVKVSDLHDTLYFKFESGYTSINDEVVLYYFLNGSSSPLSKKFNSISGDRYARSLDTSTLPSISSIESAYLGLRDTNWQDYKQVNIVKPMLTHDYNSGYSDYGSVTHLDISGVTGTQIVSINNHNMQLNFGLNYEILNGEYLHKEGSSYYIHKRYIKQPVDINSLSLSNPGLYENITPVALPKPQDDRAYNNYNKTGCMFTHAVPNDTDNFDKEAMVGCISASVIKKNYVIGFPYNTSLGDAQLQLKEAVLYYKPVGTYEQLITDSILINQLDAIYTVDLEEGEDVVNTISISDGDATLSIAYYSTTKDHSDDWVDPDIKPPVDPDDPEAPTYTHIRYSPNASGSNMTINREENSKYVGTVVTDSPLAPTNPEVYTWVLIVDEQYYAVFQDDLYEYLKTTLSENLTEGDLDIIVRLMCYIFGDLTGLTYKLEDQVDVDLAEDDYLRHLSSIIGYEWNEAFTADQQRESIKLFMDIRRRRGTKWSLENLARVLGQDVTSFYSSSDLRGVNIIEFDPNSFDKINYYDPETITTGSMIDPSDGSIITNQGTFVTDFIDISARDNFYFYEYADNTKSAAFYDKDKNFISSFNQSTNGDLSRQAGTIPYDKEADPPINAFFIRFTVNDNDEDNFKFSCHQQPDKNGLYPGDIMVEVPQFSTVLREALDNIRLIGTRIIFAYLIYMGPFKFEARVDGGIEAHLFFDPAYWGYDPLIKDWGPNGERTLITDIDDWFISHRVKSAISNASTAVYIGHKDPYTKGFIWNVPNLEDYKGFLVDDETLHDDHKMYE